MPDQQLSPAAHGDKVSRPRPHTGAHILRASGAGSLLDKVLGCAQLDRHSEDRAERDHLPFLLEAEKGEVIQVMHDRSMGLGKAARGLVNL